MLSHPPAFRRVFYFTKRISILPDAQESRHRFYSRFEEEPHE
jgi:hypothetical protein